MRVPKKAAPRPERTAAAIEALYEEGPYDFTKAVGRIVRAIPQGQTLSYSAIAGLAGRPGAPRAVVSALHALKDVPWWRVIRRDGSLAEEIALEQGRRLKREGVKIVGRRVVPAQPAKRSAKASRKGK